MAWITSADVEPILQTDLSADSYIDALIDHVQGLCEAVIGEQTEPVSSRLKATVAQIVARLWRAGKAAATSPQGYESERTDDYQYQYPSAGPMLAGFGLTTAEKKALRLAAKLPALQVVSTEREESGLEMAERVSLTSNVDLDEIL